MKKIYFWSILILSALTFFPTKILAQDTSPDSCTIRIETGWTIFSDGWGSGNLELICHGQVFATIEQHEYGSYTHFISVPSDEIVYFNWNPDGTYQDYASFNVYSESNQLLFASGNAPQQGILFVLNVCKSPQSVSDFTIIPDSTERLTATLSWTNPTLTINNDTIQNLLSIYVIRDGDTMHVFEDVNPGTEMYYVDTVPFASQYSYSIVASVNGTSGLPATQSVVIGSACQYKLVLQAGWSEGWNDGYLNFHLGGYAVGPLDLTHTLHFTLTHNNYPVTIYLFLPKGWINVEYHDLNDWWGGYLGSFSLYDENDSLVLDGPYNLPENFLWYNGCDLDIPDSVTSFTLSLQNNVVNLAWTNPTTTIKGNVMTAISRIEIRRNDELIHTFTEATPGGVLAFSDNVPDDGTYLYTVQCFNEVNGGVPAIAYMATGNNWVLHNGSNSGQYVDTNCSVSIFNDDSYIYGGTTMLTIYQSDTTKMLKVSGSAILDTGVSINIYAGTMENKVLLPSDTLEEKTPYRAVTFVFDIPAGSSPEFHYRVECVDPIYEQPDTTIAIVPDSNGIIYVTQEGAGLRNGSSWTNATPWLNRSLSIADTMTEKPMIWVASGTYYGNPQVIDGTSYSFVGHSGVNVYGGFAGNEPADYNLALRDFEQNETVLDGLLYHTVVYTGASEWNGFHIQRGTNGCKMISESALRHCVVSSCINNGITSHDYLTQIDSCRCIDNGGWGISVYYMTNIRNSEISRNASGGVSAAGELRNCFITQNGGRGYSSLGYDYSTIGVVNCLIANNDGDGIYVSDCKVTNSTIVNNKGNGIFLGNSPQSIRNCIVYGNLGEAIAKEWYVNEYDLTHCAIDGDYLHTSNNNILLSSQGDTSGFQPCFANPTAGTGSAYSGGDWHLLPNSVCVNRGVAYSDNYPDIDLNGDPRVQQGSPDIGAFESVHLAQYEDGKIIYVKEDGQGNGSSWADATNDLEYAIESAWIYGPNTQVWVAEGTYLTQEYPFNVKEGLILLGGFMGNESTDFDVNLRNHLAHPSVLDGQEQNRVLRQTMDFEQPAVVDGFVLTHGQADEGAGACLMANTTLSNCRVVNNTVTNENSAVLTAVHDTLKQLIVDNNNGTGIHAENTQIFHCTVVRNSGDGIRVSGNTIQDTNILCNSISWGNSMHNLHFTSTMTQNNTPVLHCAIENQIVESEHNITLSSENETSSGPRFINPSDSMGVVSNLGDWHLDSSSVCVNAGAELSDLYGIYTDLAGQPRVQNEKPDIGAMESTYSGEVLCRNMEVIIYEGDSYTFYDTTLTTTGWYKHRWNVGDADSLVVLHLITKHVVYVSVTGSGSKDGSSWANAIDGQTATADGGTKLAEALQAASVGTEFWIQSGTYYACSDSDVNKSLLLNEGVAIYGGFAGTETAIFQRDTNNAPTVFSGNLQNDTLVENYSRNIFKTNEQNKSAKVIILDNISITEGYNYFHDGCALHIGESSVVRANRCHIHHNFGSAVANEGFFTGNHCTLDSNISYSNYWVSYSIYYNLYTYYEGAAAFSNKLSGIAYFNHCNISHNQAPDDGALFNRGIMTIDSSCINHNEAKDGCSGAIFSEGKLTITNTTLSYNRSYNEFSTIFSIGSLVMNHCDLNNNESNRVNPLDYWLRENFYAFIDKSAHVFVDGTAEVSYCTFTHNTQNGGSGGGCLHIAGDAHIHHCEFADNIGSGSSASPFRPDNNDEEEEEESGGGIVIVLAMRSMYNDGSGVHVERGDVYVEDCIFDRNFGMNGSAASVISGRLTMDRCVFTRNNSEDLFSFYDGTLTLRRGELFVNNSLFANNKLSVLTTINTGNSNIGFTNCTFANNGSNFCHFRYPSTPYGCDSTWVNTDTAHVNVTNCILTGDWSHDMSGINDGYAIFYPNFTVNFTNTLLDTLQTVPQSAKSANLASQTIGIVSDGETGEIPTISLADAQRLLANQSEGNIVVRYNAEMQDFVGYSNTVMSEKKIPVGEKSSAKDGNTSDCTPDSLGNIYYCDPMFVNPTTVMGVDSAQDPLLYDFRLLPGSPAINSGDTTGLHLAADATDLDGEQRVKRCQIDWGCYEYGTIVYDTVRETLCVEQDALNQLSYNGHGFSISQPEVGESSFTRTCDCHPDANDTVQTLQLSVSLIQHSESNATVCDSLVWNGVTYTQSGTYTQTLTDKAGCDSVATLHLTVNATNYSAFSETVCESLVWNNETFTNSGDYTRTFTNTAGCDSVVTLHLTVHEAVETVINDYVCNGTPYPFFGQDLYYPGTYTHTMQTVHGCDSTVTLHLELAQTYQSFENAHLCDGEGYPFAGETLHTAGTYTMVLSTAHGCDSTVVLTLTTGVTTYGQVSANICDGGSYNFHGQTLTAAGVYTDTILNASGCDSIVTLNLSTSPAEFTDFAETACESFVWEGTTYTTSGDYTQTFTNASGCDSTVTLHLTVNSSVTGQIEVTTTDSCYSWNGHTYCESGDYTQTLTAANGCDSVVTLHLTITVGIDDREFGNLTLYPNPTTGIVNVECTMNNVQEETQEFHVFDAYGKLVGVVETRCTTSLQTTQINLSHYASGVYFVKAVADGNVVAVKKVVKQ